jgi:hypothetical protein
VNNTEKLDDIRRRLRHIETRLAIIQRANVVMFERITGRAFGSGWLVHDNEQAILEGDKTDAMSDDEFWSDTVTSMVSLRAGPVFGNLRPAAIASASIHDVPCAPSRADNSKKRVSASPTLHGRPRPE